MLLLQGAEVEAEAPERTGAEVLHHHVRPGDQPVEDVAPLGCLEIERHALLVAVDPQEIRALRLDERRPPGAGIVTPARLFDFDDARAHVAEQHRAIWARKNARQVEDGQAREGAGSAHAPCYQPDPRVWRQNY